MLTIRRRRRQIKVLREIKNVAQRIINEGKFKKIIKNITKDNEDEKLYIFLRSDM